MLQFFLADAEPTADDGGLGNIIFWVVMLLVMAAMIYFPYRSQKKQQKEEQKMIDTIKVGDEVTMRCGIVGQIVSMKEDTVVIVTSKDKTKIRFLKSAIARVDISADDLAASK